MPKNKLKILLVNNNTQHLKALQRELRGHRVETVVYKPGVFFNDADKDLIILSGGGGEGLEIDDLYDGRSLWYEDEMNFVLATKKPIVGICMGFEIVAKAYGAPVTQMPDLVEGFLPAQMTARGSRYYSKQMITQFEAHSWKVSDMPSKHFEVLAHSQTGIEMIRHKNRPLLASQFHPEVPGGTLELAGLLAA